MAKFLKFVVILLSILLVFLLFYNLLFLNKYFPNQKIAGVAPKDFNANNVNLPEKIILTIDDQKFTLNTSDFVIGIDDKTTLKRAYNFTRTGNYFYDLKQRISLLFKTIDTGLSIKFKDDKLTEQINTISQKIDVKPVYPKLSVVENAIVVEKGKEGQLVLRDSLIATIEKQLSLNKNDEITIPVQKTDPRITTEQANNLYSQASLFLDKKIIIEFDYQEFVYDENDLVSILGISEKYNIKKIEEIAIEIAKKVNSEPRSPKFEINDGKVTEFEASKDGVRLDYPKFKESIGKTLENLKSPDQKTIIIKLPVIKTPPNITTDKINNLGIKELLGRGYSEFKGSIPSRVHNVALAASRMDGVLIAPGETFSFNKSLGDISRFTGYQAAYVIREGRTVLGDGGGVCQVSSTLFRSALNAGLPIEERKAHAYRVGYYEQGSDPGFDATVYGPSPDLKIKNDTNSHILIQTIVDLKKPSLVFELYGTSDGRVAKVSKPVVSNVINPGPDIYVDDPTLPAGTIRQTEHRATGSRVVFDYQVEKDGQMLIDQKFVSVYRPWPAIYLRGVGQ